MPLFQHCSAVNTSILVCFLKWSRMALFNRTTKYFLYSIFCDSIHIAANIAPLQICKLRKAYNNIYSSNTYTLNQFVNIGLTFKTVLIIFRKWLIWCDVISRHILNTLPCDASSCTSS